MRSVDVTNKLYLETIGLLHLISIHPLWVEDNCVQGVFLTFCTRGVATIITIPPSYLCLLEKDLSNTATHYELAVARWQGFV